jgi:hypothetical protein
VIRNFELEGGVTIAGGELGMNRTTAGRVQKRRRISAMNGPHWIVRMQPWNSFERRKAVADLDQLKGQGKGYAGSFRRNKSAELLNAVPAGHGLI